MKVKVFFKVDGAYYSKPRICIIQIEAANEEDACNQAFEFEFENNARTLVLLQFPDKFLFRNDYAAHCYFAKGRISFDEFLNGSKHAHFFNTLKYRFIDFVYPLKSTWVYNQIEHLRICSALGLFNWRIFFRCFFKYRITVHKLPFNAQKRAWHEYHISTAYANETTALPLFSQNLVRTSLFQFKLAHTSLYYDFIANELD